MHFSRSHDAVIRAYDTAGNDQTLPLRPTFLLRFRVIDDFCTRLRSQTAQEDEQ